MKFDVPTYDYQSCNGARRAYHAVWNRDWPHDDDVLRSLARDVPEDPAYCVFGGRCAHLINAMRENDMEGGQ
jgi:hypothetical protein